MVKPKVLKMKQCIENPNELKWDEFWAYELKQKEDRGKDWDKAAAGFHKRAKKDDYHDLLFSKLILDENDSVLDLGCGEGSITLPLAKNVKKVTGVDSSTIMLELLNQRAQEEDFDHFAGIPGRIVPVPVLHRAREQFARAGGIAVDQHGQLARTMLF